ncbi:hypothetical protein HF1_12910 [Mycoplasma haemofelis str. Langford 1]|uniref:Uncharacterized protein n=1 Tax=Mycoplasma haemofelis (strain Langford 1) TaxID=941640 RepID=E8ZJH8_MYCHL|nr:hypothetical protein [Mycoplasma haemofelis]CBY93299.1 hypothetical protein HF1_12910 [Mycoplasma haemofelis str. Langford 1]
MNPTAAKALAGLGGLSAAGGGGVALYKSEVFKTKTTLGDLVKKDKWVLLTSSDTNHISKILGAYKQDSSNKPTLLFEGFTGKEGDANDRLLRECQKTASKLSEDTKKDTLLKQLKKWCVVPKTSKERLTDLGITPFPVEDPKSSASEDSRWVEKSKTHKTDRKDKFSDLSITNTGSNEEAKKLRQHCKTKLEIESFKEEFEDTLKKVEIWCS